MIAMEKRTNTISVSPNVPPRDPALADVLKPYQNCRRSIFCGFDDNKDSPGVFITTRFSESQQVHYVKQDMGMREQLTYCDEPVKECYPATSEFREALKEGLVHRAGMKRSAANGDGDGHLFVYSQDAGGDENTTYYLYHSGGKHTRLGLGGTLGGKDKSRSRKVQNRSWMWNKTNGAAVFASNARDGTNFDLYVIRSDELVNFVLSDETGGATMPSNAPIAKLIHQNEVAGYPIAKDFVGEHLLVQHYVSVTESRLFLFTFDKMMTEAVKIEEIDGKSDGDRLTASVGGSGQIVLVNSGSSTGSDVSGVVFSSDRGNDKEFRTLRYWNACGGGNVFDVTTDRICWNVTDVIYNSTSRDVLVGFNEDGSSSYYHACMESGVGTNFGQVLQTSLEKISLDGLEQGVAVGNTAILDAQGTGDSAGTKRYFGLSFVTPTRPADVYVCDLGTFSLKVWTKSEIGGLNAACFRPPRLIRYKSFDGLEIPAFVYRPPVNRYQDPCAVIVHPHGGPEGQHRPIFQPFYQFLLLELGVAIIDPNVRGSAGYGKTFVSLDNGYKREDSVKDIGALLEWIVNEGSTDPYLKLDKNRMSCWGGSYGGYMCLASLIHFNDRFVCGVDMVGISNFVTFLENTAPYRRDLRRKKYGDERDPDMRSFLQSVSPLTSADKIKAPIFVVQGKNDPRVPLSEAQQIYDTVRAKEGLEAWYMVAEDEGHGFAKKPNIDAYQDAMVQFFRKFLLSQ